MMARSAALQNRLHLLHTQWQGSPLIRLGVLGIAALLWIYGLLAASDTALQWSQEAQGLNEQARQLRPLKDGTRWKQRAEDLAVLSQRSRALIWKGISRGEIEARTQDALRTMATKTGHSALRDLRLLTDIKPDANSTPSASTKLMRIRMRLLLDFQRESALALLAELAQAEPAFVVDRLLLQNQSQTPALELELHVLAQLQEEQR